ncbi:MAG TPA: universal stress protein [Myxococcota bacterium]|nr:universal stress protein [Myxococcota bacterium]
MLSPIRNLVVPTDFSDCAAAATARAVVLARLDGATVHLVHALGVPLISAPYEVSVPAAVWEGLHRGAEARLEEERRAVEAQGVARVTATVSDGAEPAQAIRELAEACDADLVVMSTHGYGGIKHALLGSVAERAIRTIDRPVLAVKDAPGEAAEPWKRILVAVDFSDHADRAVEAAAELAARFDAAIDVVHALELPQSVVPYAWSASFGIELDERIRQSADEQMSAIEARLVARGVSPTLHVRAGRPAEVIPAAADELASDLIVMGTRGNTGIQHLLLGSVAERTLRHASCSVLVVTAEEPG